MEMSFDKIHKFLQICKKINGPENRSFLGKTKQIEKMCFAPTRTLAVRICIDRERERGYRGGFRAGVTGGTERGASPPHPRFRSAASAASGGEVFLISPNTCPMVPYIF